MNKEVQSHRYGNKIEWRKWPYNWEDINNIDLLYRLDGPTVEYDDGSKEWWVNGKWHRIGGPACEWSDGTKLWYLDDIRYSFKKYCEKVKNLMTETDYFVMVLTYGGGNE